MTELRKQTLCNRLQNQFTAGKKINMLFAGLRLVFTSDGVVVRVAIRRVERYDIVKIKPT